MQENSQPRQGKASPNDFKLQKDEHHINLSQRLFMHENETGGSTYLFILLLVVSCGRFFFFLQNLTSINFHTVLGLAMSCYVNTDLPITLSMGLEPINDGRNPNIASEVGDDKDLLANPSRGATALDHACIKYPDNYQKSSPSHNFAANNFGSALHLDLSLRRCQPNDFEERATGRATLKHSSASAFTRCDFFLVLILGLSFVCAIFSSRLRHQSELWALSLANECFLNCLLEKYKASKLEMHPFTSSG